MHSWHGRPNGLPVCMRFGVRPPSLKIGRFQPQRRHTPALPSGRSALFILFRGMCVQAGPSI